MSAQTESLKLCSGPGHDEPTWLPATEKYFYVRKSKGREGQLLHVCRLCANWDKIKSPGLSGYVPVIDAYPFFREGVNRVGLYEFCRRANISPATVYFILHFRSKRVQKRTLRKCMLEVISMRRKGEVRHRDSISCGAHLRGWEEKTPTERRDFYIVHGDGDADDKRASRARPEVRERERERDRARRALERASSLNGT